MPKSASGASSSTYFSDYYYTLIPSSGELKRGVLFGGGAYHGAYAGFACARTYYTASDTHANVGSRLCFINA
jgi:hypothetical protein